LLTCFPYPFLCSLVQNAVKESPSSFNSQSSRVVFLYGAEHDKFWEEDVLGALKKVTDEDGFNQAKGRVDGFKAAYGTVLFYEDESTIEGMQKGYAAYAPMFPIWSHHSSGMAQIHAWTALELAGYGASLQHYSNLVESVLAEKFSIPSSWKLQAQLVFGSVKAPAGDKTYMSDADRFNSLGDESISRSPTTPLLLCLM
jgi:predicted oxidoreductase (fatty acid repression mutant protein)